MASKIYCKNVGAELETWSGKLHDLAEKIDRIPSVDKYKLQPQIEELHIIMTELDDRLCAMMSSCLTVEEQNDEDAGVPGVEMSSPSNQEKDVRFDYDFGG